MKTMKKLLSIVMVLALVLSLGVSAFALDITVEEKVEGTTGAQYTAWKLLNLTTTEEELPDGKGFSYTVNDDFRTILQEVTTKTKDEDIIDYLSNLGKDGFMTVDAFTTAVYEKIAAKGNEVLYAKGVTSDENVFTDMDQGYYLIIETTIGKVGEQDGVATKLILDTAGRGNLTVTTKEDKPSIDKKVKDINDAKDAAASGWQMSGDWDIGDHVPFQITATVEKSDTYSLYKAYKTVLHDKQCDGLTFLPETLKLIANDVTYYYNKDNGTFATEGGAVATGVSLNYNGGSKYEDGCTFEIVINDTKALNVPAGGQIVAEYESVLNDGAAIGLTGNPNEVKLEFSNDYLNDGTGETPYVGVIVFTYQTDVDKVDGDNKPLGEAGFALLKKYLKLEGNLKASEYSYEAVQKAAKGDWFAEKVGEETVYWQVVDRVAAVKENTNFSFKGIDDGDYRLVETEVPDGYNKAEDINFTVTVTHNEKDGTKTAISGSDLSVTSPMKVAQEEDGSFTGHFETDVINRTGVELPSTGGIGTTIFYVVGAILVAGAVILLVTKKRVSGANK